MNNLIAMGNEMTMTSTEIADLTGKRHDHVLRDARKMLDEIQSPQNWGDYQDSLGRSQPCLLMSKDETFCLIAGYDAAIRMKIIKRWQELEAQHKPSIPQTYAAALLEAGRLAMELERSQQQLAIAAPKADVFDKVMERETLLNATQVAQQVGMSAIAMNKKLDTLGGVYNKCVKRGRVFCHDWVLSGYGEMKMTEQGYPQPLFTAKGSMRVVEMFVSEGVV